MNKRDGGWVTAEIILKVLTWIENIFIYLFKGKTALKEKKNKDELKRKMREARRASIEGDENAVNMMMETNRLNKVADGKVEK